MSPEEREFVKALAANPDDEATRRIYSDFLRDQGRPDSADMVEKSGMIPGVRDVPYVAPRSGQLGIPSSQIGQPSLGAPSQFYQNYPVLRSN